MGKVQSFLYELNSKISPSIIKFPEMTGHIKDYDRYKYLTIIIMKK